MNANMKPMNGVGPGTTKGAKALATERAIKLARAAKRGG